MLQRCVRYYCCVSTQGVILFAEPWTLAAVCDSDSREKFDRFYRDLVTDKNEDFRVPASIGKLEGIFPDVGRAMDFCYEVWLCLEALI